MKEEYKEFSRLFNHYRLKSQFETLSQFGEALAREGFFFEDSMFSRWKNANRIPKNRKVALAILKLFIKRNAITTRQEANSFLLATHHSILQASEYQQLFQNTYHYPSPSPSPEYQPQLTEDEALYLAQKILGKPYTQIYTSNLKQIYNHTKHSVRKYLSILKQIEQKPESIHTILSSSEQNIIRDKFSSKYILRCTSILYIKNTHSVMFSAKTVRH